MNKIVATILLDQDDNYICEDGELPERPEWDKELLHSLVKGEYVSAKGFITLPPSMRRDVMPTDQIEPFPVCIDELNALADILIVSRSKSKCGGKKFRFDNFESIVKLDELEIWRRK